MEVDDLKQDSTFCAFISIWEKEADCPIELIDYLLDLGINKEAEAFRYVFENKQPIIECVQKATGKKRLVIFYPCCCFKRNFIWYRRNIGNNYDCCNLANTNFEIENEVEFGAFIDAILYLLKSFKGN